MVAQVFLAKGAVVPEHFHESEQITYILEGRPEIRDGRQGGRGRHGPGAADPVERAAPRGGARRHARSRHLQPDPPRLAERRTTLTCGGEKPMDLGLKDRVAIVAASSQGTGQGGRAGAGARGREAGAMRAHRVRRSNAAADEIRRRDRRRGPDPRVGRHGSRRGAAFCRGHGGALRTARYLRRERRRSAFQDIRRDDDRGLAGRGRI